MRTHIVQFSGGVSSWAAAKRVAAQHGTDDLVLLFCDTKNEDEDLYRFLTQAAKNVGGKLIRIADGRDLWQLYEDHGMIANTRAAICSRTLKVDLAKRWIAERYNPDSTMLYVGISWDESHRLPAIRRNWQPFEVVAPLTRPPYMLKTDMFNWLGAEGIAIPRLYRMGMEHNNCGGFCIKAGQGHFAHLLRVLPERYLYHEGQEEAFRERTGKDVSILRDRTGGTVKPLTLRQLRKRVEDEGESFDSLDWGGCGCMSDEEV